MFFHIFYKNIFVLSFLQIKALMDQLAESLGNFTTDLERRQYDCNPNELYQMVRILHYELTGRRSEKFSEVKLEDKIGKMEITVDNIRIHLNSLIKHSHEFKLWNLTECYCDACEKFHGSEGLILYKESLHDEPTNIILHSIVPVIESESGLRVNDIKVSTISEAMKIIKTLM